MSAKFTSYTAAKPATKYATLGRSSLLSIVLFSVINLVSVPLGGGYFVFSSYFSLYASAIGTMLYETNDNNLAFVLIFSGIALVLLLPYLLCYIFSAKHVGWMIAATVLFGIETVLSLGDMLISLAGGDVSMLLDGALHVLVMGMLIVALRDGILRTRRGVSLVDPLDGVVDPATAEPTNGDEMPTAFPEETQTTAHSDAVERERKQNTGKWE